MRQKAHHTAHFQQGWANDGHGVHHYQQRDRHVAIVEVGAGGPLEAQQCGWLKDKFGVSWQIVPVAFMHMMRDADTRKSQREMQAMYTLKKLDIAQLERAFAGQS